MSRMPRPTATRGMICFRGCRRISRTSLFCGIRRAAPLRSRNTDASLFIFSRDEDVWLYPFLRQRIAIELAEGSTTLLGYDIESAYGYGGPLATSGDESFWLKPTVPSPSGLATPVSSPSSCGSIPSGKRAWLRSRTEIVHDRDTVSVNLSNVANGTSQFGINARNMIRRAESAGINVNSYSPSTHLNDSSRSTRRRCNGFGRSTTISSMTITSRH